MCQFNSRFHRPANGDVQGARDVVHGTTLSKHRYIGTGSRAVGSSSIATQNYLDPIDSGVLKATHLPRIDCSSYTNDYATCAAVVPFEKDDGTSSTRIIALEGWSSANGWTNASNVVTFDAQHTLPPDIALSPYGTEAYVVRVGSTNSTFLTRIDLQTGAIQNTTLSFRSTLPPRIDFSEDGVVVIGHYAASPGEANRWIGKKARWNGSSFNIETLAMGNLGTDPAEVGTRTPLGEFDFACRHNLLATDQCVLVAPLLVEGDVSHFIGSLSSRQFSVSSSGTMTLASTWTHGGDRRATGVIGVALGTRLVVSSARRTDNNGTTNTWITEYLGYDVGTPAYTFTHRSDIQTDCQNATANGITLGAATPHGGYSIDYCLTCGGGSGRYESIQFYKEVGGSQTFCF